MPLISPRILSVLIGCAFGASCPAQGVTISAAATTSIDLWTWAYVGGQLNYSQPAGPLAASGIVGQPFGWFSTANVNWATDLPFTLRPDNYLALQQEVDSCLPGIAGLEPPFPVFADDGVDLHFSPGLLVPQPDILIWLPSGCTHIALPPAVRPVQSHVQVVFLSAVGIVASDGYQITAN